MEGRSVISSLARVKKGKNVSMDVKRGLRHNIFLLMLMFWFRDIDVEWDTVVMSVYCQIKLPKRAMWCDKMGW